MFNKSALLSRYLRSVLLLQKTRPAGAADLQLSQVFRRAGVGTWFSVHGQAIPPRRLSEGFSMGPVVGPQFSYRVWSSCHVLRNSFYFHDNITIRNQ